MNASEYVAAALKTETQSGISSESRHRLLHAGMGLSTESGEFLDCLKKSLFYGKHFDRVNAIEELGDLFWYLAVACDALGVTFEDVWHKNIKKLQVRYPGKFEQSSAITRDFTAERIALES